MQFSTLYTGENSAVKMPELDAIERSSQRAGQLQIKAEEMKLEKALRNEKEFLAMMKVDPIAAVTKRDTLKQAYETEKYNNKWGERYLKGQGELSTADKVELQMDKANLVTMQNKILSNQKRIAEAEDVIQRDKTGYYDRKYWDKVKQDYLSNSNENYDLPPVLLKVSPQDIKSLLAKDPPQTAKAVSYDIDVTDPKTGNVTGKQRVSEESKRTREEAQEQIFDKFKIEPAVQFVIEDFLSLPEKDQYEALKDYDTNGNHRIDPDELDVAKQNVNIRDNPIVKWAMNYEPYIKASMGSNPSTPKNISQPRAAGNGFSLVLFGRKVSFAPGSEGDPVPYGDQTYNQPIDFDGSYILKNVPTVGGKELRGQSVRPVTSKGNIEGYLKHYDRERDVFILAATGTDRDINNGTLMEIPASNLNQREINKIPVYVNGKLTTLGEIRANKTTAQTPKTGELDSL